MEVGCYDYQWNRAKALAPIEPAPDINQISTSSQQPGTNITTLVQQLAVVHTIALWTLNSCPWHTKFQVAIFLGAHEQGQAGAEQHFWRI